MNNWVNKLQGLVYRMDSLMQESRKSGGVEPSEEAQLKRAIEKARRELMATRSFFDSVVEPDMVDHAIYSMQAAERKYAYLLKYAREKGYRQHLDETLRERILEREGK